MHLTCTNMPVSMIDTALKVRPVLFVLERGEELANSIPSHV